MPPDTVPRRSAAVRRKGDVAAPREPAPTRADLVARALAADILDGRRAVGSELPAEAELAAAQGSSLAAVRSALRDLEGLGLIARTRGEAARVIASDVRAGYAVAGRVEKDTGDYTARTRLLIERQRVVTGDLDLAMLLGTPEGATWLRLSGLRYAADAVFGPLSCVDVWLATRAESLDLPEEVSPAVLEDLLGVGIVEVEEEVMAGALTPAQARYLRARGGAPCLSLLRRYRKRGGTVIAAMRDVHPADRVGVVIRLRRV